MSQTYRNWPETSQRRIMHHYGQFYDFLVDHPFCNNNTTTSTDSTTSSSSGNATAPNGTSFEMGVHHQQYRINGYLIAVGVVDILPRGLSSVYLFYDPSFSQYLVPLGTFTSLREINWTRDVARLPNYYLGYYIHSKTKMRYKANFKPSQLLCPETYKWVPANIAQDRIERLSPLHHCCRLVPTDETDDSDAAAAERRLVMEQELSLEVGFGQVVQLVQLQEAARTFLRPFLSDFIKQAGPAVSRQCVIDFR
jgi:arginyl-tRNA---protein transferase